MTSLPGDRDTAAGSAPTTGATVPGESGRRLGLALFLVSAAQFVLQLDFSIVNVALATIQREFGVSAADLQWLVTGYALPFGALLLLGGRLGDMTGHRRQLIAGLTIFGVMSLLAGLAADAGVLIGARFAQGASAALVAPMTLAAITDLYPEGPGRARAMGIYQGATAAGASAGIVLGGILTSYIGWRAIFLVNPPVIVVLVAAMIRLLPADHPGRPGAHPGAVGRPRLDVAGAVLVTASVAALIFGLSQGQQHGFGAPLTLVSLVVAVALGVAFVLAERRAPAPMVPLAVLTDPSRRVALGVMFTVASVIVGYVYFITLYMQRVLHFSPLQAGLALLPATLTVMATSTLIARRAVARFGAKWVLVTAMVSIGLGQVWLSQISASGSYPVNVLAGLVLTAFGMGLLFPTAAVLATAGVSPGDRGLAGGLFAAAQQVGMALGLAVLATIAAARTRSATAHGLTVSAALVSGYRLAYLVGAVIVACAVLVTLFFLRPARSARPAPPLPTDNSKKRAARTSWKPVRYMVISIHSDKGRLTEIPMSPPAILKNECSQWEAMDVTGQEASGAADPDGTDARFDVGVAHVARVYDYWLGGKDNFAADRVAGEKTVAIYPGIRLSARANRAFLARTVGYLTASQGIRQFLDIGTGLPTANNTHEIAQALAPESRIVYVDNDPLVLAHARALLTSRPEGVTAYLDADLRDTDKIIEQAARTLDFTRPVAIMLMAILHYIPDEAQARQIVARLLASVPAGSFVTISHAGSDLFPEDAGAFEESLNKYLPGDPHTARAHDAVARFFDGMELLAPGVVRVSEWRPGSHEDASAHTTLWGGVGRKR